MHYGCEAGASLRRRLRRRGSAIGRLIPIKGFDIPLRARARSRLPGRSIAGQPLEQELRDTHRRATLLGHVDGVEAHPEHTPSVAVAR